MAKLPKFKTKYPGVRYYEHPERIFKKKPDKYFSIRFRVNGKQYEEGLGWASQGCNETEANETLSELKKNYRTGDGARTLKEKRKLNQRQTNLKAIEEIKKRKENITFNEVWEKYFKNQKSNVSERSWKREDSLYRLWISPVISNLPMKKIGELHLQKIRSEMEKSGRKPRTIKYSLDVIRQVFNFINRTEGLDYKSPTKLPNKKIKFDNKRDRFLTQEEARLLLSAIKKRSQSLYEISLLSLHTGMRAGEIFALEWSDINLENRDIFIKDTKSSKNRHALMTEDIKQIFEGKIKGKPHELVFCDRNGKKRKAISKAFAEAVKEVGLNDGIEDDRKKVVFHSFRHTYASWLVQNGISIYELKGLLGHSTIAMSERYSHLSPDNGKKSISILESMFSESESESDEGSKAKVINIRK